jgi:hypothetical protein
VGNLNALAQSTNTSQPFQLAVASSVPLNTIATLRYRLTAAGGYQTDQYLNVRLNPDFVQLDAGDLVASLSSRGSLAYDVGYDQGGLGVSYRTVGPRAAYCWLPHQLGYPTACAPRPVPYASHFTPNRPFAGCCRGPVPTRRRIALSATRCLLGWLRAQWACGCVSAA